MIWRYPWIQIGLDLNNEDFFSKKNLLRLVTLCIHPRAAHSNQTSNHPSSVLHYILVHDV